MADPDMLIDLTQDSDSEDQVRIKPARLFPGLAHRTLSSTIPLKRKSDRDSESSVSPFSTAIQQTNNHSFNHTNNHHVQFPKQKSQPYTPSPAPETPGETTSLSVVVPSPSAQLKREIDSAGLISESELTGLSENYYPTDAHEQRATRGAYPAKRKVKRSDFPFIIGTPGPFLTDEQRKPVNNVLYESLRRKLASIKGPAVTVAPEHEMLLARDIQGFEFVNDYKLRKDVHPIGEEFIAGCSCNKTCDPDRCQCLALEENSNMRIQPYKQASDDKRFLVLSPEFMSRTSMIYECQSLCGCDETCWNRVIGHGRTIRLEIFHTGNRGFGLRSPDRIRAGQFIDLYLGEVITKQTADVREEIARNAPSYLFSLDFLVNDDDIYVVDGRNFGAPTRFINHSCNPNCRLFAVSRTHGDERIYDLAFFSLREIPTNTELTFDYNPKMEKVSKVDPNAVPCLCGEPNCRGQLWANERKRAK